MKKEALTEVKEILGQQLQERAINPLFIPIVNDYMNNLTIEEIAVRHGLNVLEVSLLLEKPEIKNYCNQCIAQVGYLNRLSRINLINKVIDQKVLEAEEDGQYSKKDLLEWVKLLEEASKNLLAAKPKTAIQVNQMGENNTIKLIEELLESESD